MFRKTINKGFTLIELLVGMAIIVVSATAVVVLLSSSFRISNKTTSLSAIRESGNNAVNFFQRTVQFAGGFDSAIGPTTTVTNCVGTNAGNYTSIRVHTSSGIVQQFSCSVGDSFTYDQDVSDANPPSSLINTSKVTIACTLTCTQASNDVPPIIGINLSLSLKNTSNVPEKNASIAFSTSAKMRNL